MKGEELWLVIVDMTNVVINTVVDRLEIRRGQNGKLNHGLAIIQVGMLFFDLKTVLLHK